MVMCTGFQINSVQFAHHFSKNGEVNMHHFSKQYANNSGQTDCPDLKAFSNSCTLFYSN